MVVPSGTKSDTYPDTKLLLVTPVSNAVVNESKLEYKLNGPVPAPDVVNVISTDIVITYNYLIFNYGI